MFVPLSSLGDVRLGFKSLQNAFFYLDETTVRTFGIEERFLTPILMRRAMNGSAYLQSVTASQWLFNCRERKEDLRGTGAWRYIEAMGDRNAARKKQTGKSRTIREVLEAQSGSIWYAPKARPKAHRIWMRKAIDGVFAPLLFEDAALVDQRFNSIAPSDDICWEELAGLLTSTLFAYSVEINGSASMGAGALEAPTKKLRGYPIADIRALTKKDRKKLVSLAREVWKREIPVDWSSEDGSPGEALRELDGWLLKKCKREVSIERLYEDLGSVSRARIFVARDKVKKTKKHREDSIVSVAESIVKAIGPRLETRNFPDGFVEDGVLDINFSIERRNISNH